MAKSPTTKTTGSKSTGKKSAAAKASKGSTGIRIISRTSLKPGTMAGKLIVAPDAFSKHELHDYSQE